MSRQSSALAAASIDNGRADPAQNDADASGGFTISDLARDFGVTLRTLRFYESRGLIAPAPWMAVASVHAPIGRWLAGGFGQRQVG
jgi:predicted secreted protein